MSVNVTSPRAIHPTLIGWFVISAHSTVKVPIIRDTGPTVNFQNIVLETSSLRLLGYWISLLQEMDKLIDV